MCCSDSMHESYFVYSVSSITLIELDITERVECHVSVRYKQKNAHPITELQVSTLYNIVVGVPSHTVEVMSITIYSKDRLVVVDSAPVLLRYEYAQV